MTFKENKIVLTHPKSHLIYGFRGAGCFVVPPHYQPKCFDGDTLLWLLPANPNGGSAYKISCGEYHIKGGVISFLGEYSKEEFPPRPCCDFLGQRFSLDIENGEDFQRAYACFYWDNLLPQIAERTFLRRKRDIRDGYVLSTLNKKAYAGTYPAVDHEFHMKGRLAVGGGAEAALIRRMLVLQMKVMREDKTGQSKNLCAVQPNGRREYDVWRKSKDRSQKAQMFRITANIEFVEGMYNYYCLTKDLDFLRTNITAMEKNCAYIEKFVTVDGFLDSHVYYEDQVIKDGAVSQAQCFAVNSLRLMTKLEGLLQREKMAKRYDNIAKFLGDTIPKDFPKGFWDGEKGRFIDWIHSDGKAHDRVHLLANQLPELFGIGIAKQHEKSRQTIEKYGDIWRKFPSFVAAKIEDYGDNEIGTGGPYDLCAAGRYWCWDAEYLAFKGDGASLARQLKQVSAQAKLDGYLMGERYDMNYVYYNTGADGARNWHGASLYYEYPNVFLYVLVCCYLGLRRGFDCDLVVAPLVEKGRVRHEGYGIEYTKHSDGSLELLNISGREILVDLPQFGKRVRVEIGGTVRV
ncbi:MAG: hypothetical protein FWG82_05050 [Oscillospiraceae bacterium]|nr:hypothetical protein [Oscillospiraceae bacterium]